MAEKSDTTETTDPIITAGEAVMKQMEDAGLGPLRWMGEQWMFGLAEINGEVADFVAQRIGEDVKLQHEILHCKDAAEVQAVQLAFLEKVYDQYNAETGKLLKMWVDLLPGTGPNSKGTPV